MKRLFLTLAGVLASLALSARATILLNEVHLNPPNPDNNYEFIELKSTTGGQEALTGLWIVIINNDKVDADIAPPNNLENLGEIQEVYSLNDFRTGSNGLILLGNGYTSSPRGGPWSGFVDPATTVADPSGMGDSDIGSNDGLTILLVSGLTGVVKGQDVDVDDDTLLDWADPTPPAGPHFSVQPWTTLVDSIGTRDRGEDNGGVIVNPYVPGATVATGANISQTWLTSSLGPRDPDTFARHLNMNTASRASDWYGGKLTGQGSTTVTYQTTRIFGPGSPGMLGEVTPGRANLAATLPATSFRINEVGLNPDGINDRFQYIEIINTTGGARSLNGYWLIMLDSFDNSANANDSSPGVGQIIEKWDLAGMATGTNGLLLIGNDFSSSYNAFHDLVAPQTGFGDPEAHPSIPADPPDPAVAAATGMGEGDVGFKNGFTLLLVQNFTGVLAPGEDLDTNNDGTLDSQPTGTIIDTVGFTQVDKSTIGKTYSTVDLRTVMHAKMVPDNFSRKLGNLSVGTAAWYGGVYPDGSAGFDVAYSIMPEIPTGGGAAYNPWFGGFRGAGTPGLPNLAAAIDAATPPVAASIRINEVMFNPTNTEVNDRDDTREYIELASTNGGLAYLDNLWVVVVDLEGNIGNVAESFPLDGNLAGLNGLAMIGDNFDDSTSYPYAAVDGALTPFAAAIDPVVSIGGNDLPNDGMCIMVIRGPKTGAGNPFSLSVDGLTLSGDLDPENDGTLLAPSAVAVEVLDSIAVAPVNPGAGYGWISNVAFKPHHIARYPANLTASTGAAFYYGQVSQTASAAPAIEYTGVFAGTFKGAASPGRPNHGAPTGPVTIGSVILNELNIDPPGADNNFEFVELLDVAGRRRSLNGYYLVMIDNVTTNTGSVRHSWSLDGMFTGDNGLFVLGNRYLGPANNPWSTVMRPQTQTGDPAGREGLATSLTDGSFGDETDNLNVMFLLVRGFNKYVGYDMDDKVGDGQPLAADHSGDGVFDKVAWSGGLPPAGIHDSVMFRDYIATTPPPATPPPGYPWNGFPYAGIADIGTTYLMPAANVYYHPDTLARFVGEFTPNSALAWYGGDLDGGPAGNSGTGIAYFTAANDPLHPPFPAGFTGRLTPGQPNLARDATTNVDGDGLPTFMELAFGTDPLVSGLSSALPVVGKTNIGGADYVTITYQRIKGGTSVVNGLYAAEAYTYAVESSTDLQTWIPGSSAEQVGTATPNADGVTETATYRLTASTTHPDGRAFLRLKIGRP